MEISVKFSPEELRLIWQALKLGAIHTPDENKSQQMSELQNKIQILGSLSQEEKK